MNGLQFNERNHRYTLDGKPVQGVTTILGGGLPKPELMYWAAKKVAEEAIYNINVWANRAENEDPAWLVDELKKAHTKERDKAAVRGTAVHELAEKLITTGEITLGAGEENLRPYIEHYADLLEAMNITPLYAEIMLGNRSQWYAGTTDLIADIDGQTWLLDLKTSNHIHGSYALQCAAYANAEFYIDDTGCEAPMMHIDRIGAIHLQPDGAIFHPFDDLNGAWDAFLAVKKVNDLSKTIKNYGA